jgi:hypothetical protein
VTTPTRIVVADASVRIKLMYVAIGASNEEGDLAL